MKKIWKIILNYISLDSSSKLNMKGSFKSDIIVLHWPVSSLRKNLNEVFGQSSTKVQSLVAAGNLKLYYVDGA